MTLEGAKVLVTGAGGFIGSHLVEALCSAGAKVTAMIHYDSRPDASNLDLLSATARADIRTTSGNLEDPFFVSASVSGQDVVFHLGALIAIPYSYVAPASYVTTNVVGTLNVLEACRRHEVRRLIHTSTSEVFGSALYTPMDESHPLQAQSPYAATKVAADKLAESYFLSFGLPVTTVRPFNTYGPRQSARAVVPTIISQALFADRIRIGSLTPVRDLNFVADTVAGFLAAARADAAVGQVVNLGTGLAVSIGDLAATIIRLVGREVQLVVDNERVRPEASEVLRLVADSRKAQSLTGWAPTHSLAHGLGATIDFVRRHANLFRPEVYTR
jgi:NAD dependent epimerase/dehydratase